MALMLCPRCKKEIDFYDLPFQTEEHRLMMRLNPYLEAALFNDMTLKLLDEMKRKLKMGQFNIISVWGTQGKGKTIVGFDLVFEMCKMILYKFMHDNLGFSYSSTLTNLALAVDQNRIKRSVFLTDEQEAEHGKGKNREADQITAIVNITRQWQPNLIFISPSLKEHNHHYVLEIFDYGFELINIISNFSGTITEINPNIDLEAGEVILKIKNESGTHDVVSLFWATLKELGVKVGDEIKANEVIGVLDARTHTRCLVTGTGQNYVGIFISEYPQDMTEEFVIEYKRRKDVFIKNTLMQKGSERYNQRMKIVNKLIDDDEYWKQYKRNHKIIYIKANHVSGWTEDEYKEVVDLTEIERMKKYGSIPEKPKKGKKEAEE